MRRYLLGRAAVALATLLIVSLLAFTVMNVAVDPAIAIAGEAGSSKDVAAVAKAYGFDRPLLQRYGEWMVKALQGDLGMSYRQRRPVADIMIERLPVTFGLGALAVTLALALAVPLGVAAALRPNSYIDRLALIFALVGQAMPSFWFALMLILVFGVWLSWFPISGSESIWHFVLPAIALGYYGAPTIMRLTRAGMLEALSADYVRTARAKGLRMRQVVLKHALRNAVLPVVAVAAVQFGFMLGGSVVIESVFALRGVGYLAWEAISQADLPVIQAIVLTMALIYVVLIFFADVLNALLDPRIRVS